MTELSDVPGRDRDLDQLVQECTAVIQESRGGRVLFIAGGPASGRGPLLRALAAQLEAGSQEPIVLAGRFVGGQYEADKKDPTALQQVLARIKQLGEAGEWIASVLVAAGQLGVGRSLSSSARRFAFEFSEWWRPPWAC
jgi:hypothetical protein